MLPNGAGPFRARGKGTQGLRACIQLAPLGVSTDMHPTRFVLISRWRLHCAPSLAWDLLTHLEGWPQWWPHVRHVRMLRRAAPGETGTHTELTWRTPLGYAIRIDALNTRTERFPDGHGEIEGISRGDLQGHGLWLIEPVGEHAVDLTYRYQVELTRPWMRRLAPCLSAVFAWSHFTVMRAGAQGMARQLGCKVSELVNWRGGTL